MTTDQAEELFEFTIAVKVRPKRLNEEERSYYSARVSGMGFPVTEENIAYVIAEEAAESGCDSSVGITMVMVP